MGSIGASRRDGWRRPCRRDDAADARPFAQKRSAINTAVVALAHVVVPTGLVGWLVARIRRVPLVVYAHGGGWATGTLDTYGLCGTAEPGARPR